MGFREFLLKEAVTVTGTQMLKYLKLIQKGITAKGFTISEVNNKGAWTVTFTGSKIGDLTLAVLNSNKEKKISSGNIVGYSLDGTNFVQIPASVTSLNDLYKNVQILKNLKGVTKSFDKLILTSDTTDGISVTGSTGNKGKKVTREELEDMIKNDEDVTNVDVSGITDMSGLFKDASSFNQDISKWDVSNVTDMSSMFKGATSFNRDISKWNVSKVDDMSDMFAGASSFNQDISKWDVSNVKDMGFMFYKASSFNQDISKWNVSNVKYMIDMFDHATKMKDIYKVTKAGKKVTKSDEQIIEDIADEVLAYYGNATRFEAIKFAKEILSDFKRGWENSGQSYEDYYDENISEWVGDF